MDDVTLNPAADGSQAPGGDLAQIVQRLAARLGRSQGPPQALDGGITNRNFRVRLGGDDYVIRVPGKDTSLLGIDRGAERLANERAAAAGIAPRVAAALESPACLITEFVDGEVMSSSGLRETEALADVAGALRTIHDLDQPFRSRFDSVLIVQEYADLAEQRGVDVPAACGGALERAREIDEALTGAEHEPVPCHNDLLAANFIRSGDRLWIVDWEYAGMGDRYFDLANFAVNNGLSEAQEEALLASYFDRGDPSLRQPPRRLAALRLMGFMSDFREAMWGVVQSAVSEIEFDFGGYAGSHFERLEARAADPRFDGWLEAAGGA